MITLAESCRIHDSHEIGTGKRRPHIALKHWPQVHQTVAVSDPSKILLVEDDDKLRSRLAGSLRQEGYSVFQCRNGRQLTDLIDVFGHAAFFEDFDLIIIDSNMPGFSGLTILNWLSESNYGPPLILITSADDELTHEAAKQLCAVGTVDKPFEIDELMDTVHEFLF